MILMPFVVFSQWLEQDGHFINQTNFENIKQFKVDYESKEIIIVEFDKIYFIDLISGEINKEYDILNLDEFKNDWDEITLNNDNSIILTSLFHLDNKSKYVQLFAFDLEDKHLIDTHQVNLMSSPGGYSHDINACWVEYIDSTFIVQIDDDTSHPLHVSYLDRKTYLSRPLSKSININDNSSYPFLKFSNFNNKIFSSIYHRYYYNTSDFEYDEEEFTNLIEIFNLLTSDVNEIELSHFKLHEPAYPSNNYFDITDFTIGKNTKEALILSEQQIFTMNLNNFQIIDTISLSEEFEKIELCLDDNYFILAKNYKIVIMNKEPFFEVESYEIATHLRDFGVMFFEEEKSLVFLDYQKKLNLIKPNFLQNDIKARFIADSNKATTSSNIKFFPQTFDSTFSFNWDFGDGEKSTLQYPIHNYKHSGTYSVRLIISDGYTSDTLIKNNYIKIIDDVEMKFSFDRIYPDKNIFKFNNETIGNYDRVLWEFGEGTKNETNELTHEFLTKGDFSIELIIYFDDFEKRLKKEFALSVLDFSKIEPSLFDDYKLFSLEKDIINLKAQITKNNIINVLIKEPPYQLDWYESYGNYKLLKLDSSFRMVSSEYFENFEVGREYPRIYSFDFIGDNKLWITNFALLKFSSDNYDIVENNFRSFKYTGEYIIENTFDDWYLHIPNINSNFIEHKTAYEDDTYYFKKTISGFANYFFDRKQNELILYTKAISYYDLKGNLVSKIDEDFDYDNILDLIKFNSTNICIVKNKFSTYSINAISSGQNKTIFSDSLMTINQLHYLSDDLLIAQANIGNDNYLILVNKYLDVKIIKIKEPNLKINLFEEHLGKVYAFGSYNNDEGNHLFIGKLNDFSDFISVSDENINNNQEISFSNVNNDLIINSKVNSRVDYIIYNYMGQVLFEGNKLLKYGKNKIELENISGAFFVNIRLGNEFYNYKYIGR